MDQSLLSQTSPRRAALRIALIYGAIASAWILGSGWLLRLVVVSPDALVLWEIWKGLGFVGFTSMLLFVLLQRHLRLERESERRFALLVENLPGMVYRCDNDRRWTMRYASQAAERLTGYPPKALIGNAQVAFGDLICPDDRERVWETVQRAVKTGSVFQVEYRLVRRDGVMVSVWEQGRAIEDPDDPGRQVIEGLMLDVTERVLAESVAQEAAERLETLGDNLPGGAIYRLVRDPAGLYQFTYASRGIEQVLGVSRDRILADAQAAFGLTEPPYADGLAEANERSARDLSVFNVELPLRLKDERRKWIAVRSMPRAMPDGSVLWDGVVTDITSQKEVALEAMEARATLETALASMSDAVMISDAKGHIIHLNAAFARFQPNQPADRHRRGRPRCDRQSRRDALPGRCRRSGHAAAPR